MRENMIDDLLYANIHGFDRLDCGFKVPCMTHHIGVRKIEHHEIEPAGIYDLAGPFRDLVCAHLGLEVVGGYGRGGYQLALLSGVRLFNAAVEEEGDVGILLRFGDVELRFTETGKVLRKGILRGLRTECNIHPVVKGSVILSEANVMHGEITVFALEFIKDLIYEAMSDLPCAVGTEIEEKDAVILLYGRHRTAVGVCDNGREHEFIGQAGIVRSMDGFIGG